MNYFSLPKLSLIKDYQFTEELTEDWENTYKELTYIKDESHWQKYIYHKAELPKPADMLECSFMCRNVQKSNGCDLFLMEVGSGIMLCQT